MAKHRAFNADRFLDKFQGHEDLLRAYVSIWNSGLQVDADSLDVQGFKEFVVNGDGDRKDEFMEGLYRAYDLSNERGHEDLVASCLDLSFDPDPGGVLPVECLSLKVRTRVPRGSLKAAGGGPCHVTTPLLPVEQQTSIH